MHERIKLEKAEFIIVYDNETAAPNVRASHGFACAVRTQAELGLFDTGQDGKVLLQNLGTLGFSPSDFRWVLISHDHYDHCGGLNEFLNENNDLRVYVTAKSSQTLKDTIASRHATVVELAGPAAVAEGIYSSGPLSAKMAEQALVIDTVLGLVVLFGCAHTGLTKSLRTIKDTWPGRIHLVLGGFHLREESETTIRDIICQLKALEVLNVGPAHCTGAAACRLLREAYNEKFLDAAAGQVIAVTS